MRPLSEYQGQPVYKICYIAEKEEDLAPARAAYEDQFEFCQQTTFKDGGGVVSGELINRKFNKGDGIRRICDHLGMPLSSVIAFGDSPNDLEMTNVAAISYCMANGSDDLKARCDRVCPAVKKRSQTAALFCLGLCCNRRVSPGPGAARRPRRWRQPHSGSPPRGTWGF